MSRFDHDSKMYRFPSFHETATCDQAKTAQDSLRDILAKFPTQTSRSSTGTASPPSSSSSSTASSPPLSAPLPPASVKRPSNASDYKWINTSPRSSGSSASSKSSTSSNRKRQSSLTSNGSRKSPSRHLV